MNMGSNIHSAPQSRRPQFDNMFRKPLNGKVLTMTPAYGFFLHACEYNGVELVTSPLREENGRFSVDWEDLETKAADPDVKLLMLCNPHNPTGRIWTEEELRPSCESTT